MKKRDVELQVFLNNKIFLSFVAMLGYEHLKKVKGIVQLQKLV